MCRRDAECAVCGYPVESIWSLCPSCGSSIDQDVEAVDKPAIKNLDPEDQAEVLLA